MVTINAALVFVTLCSILCSVSQASTFLDDLDEVQLGEDGRLRGLKKVSKKGAHCCKDVVATKGSKGKSKSKKNKGVKGKSGRASPSLTKPVPETAGANSDPPNPQKCCLNKPQDVSSSNYEETADYKLVLDVKYICNNEVLGFGKLENTLLTYHNVINSPCEARFTEVNIIDFEEAECCKEGNCESYFQNDFLPPPVGGRPEKGKSMSFRKASKGKGDCSRKPSGKGTKPLKSPSKGMSKGPKRHRDLQRFAIVSRIRYNTRARCSVILGCRPNAAPAERRLNRVLLEEQDETGVFPSTTPFSVLPSPILDLESRELLFDYSTDRPILVGILNSAGFTHVRDADYVEDKKINCSESKVCFDKYEGYCCGLDNCSCPRNPLGSSNSKRRKSQKCRD